MKKRKKQTSDVEIVIGQAFECLDRKNFRDLAICATLGSRTHLLWLEPREVLVKRLTKLVERGATVEAFLSIEETALGCRPWATTMEGVSQGRAKILLQNFAAAV